MRDFNQQAVMKDLTQFSKIYLVPFADFHIGCHQIAWDKISGYINWLKNTENAFTFLNGDMLNCAGKDTTPELWEDLITPDDAYKQLLTILLPIKKKILMITRGGHEGHMFRKAGVDFMSRLACDLGDIPYKSAGGALGIWLGRNGHTALFRTYGTHGWGGARTTGAKVNKAQDLQKIINADCYVLSHDHTQAVSRGSLLEFPSSRLRNKRVYLKETTRLFVNTGGFIKYGGYIQEKGYTPQPMRTPRIRFELKKTHEGYVKDLHASI